MFSTGLGTSGHSSERLVPESNSEPIEPDPDVEAGDVWGLGRSFLTGGPVDPSKALVRRSAVPKTFLNSPTFLVNLGKPRILDQTTQRGQLVPYIYIYCIYIYMVYNWDPLGKRLMIVRLSGPLVRRSAGPLVRRFAGPLVRWSAGPAVRWSAGPPVRRSAGPPVRWSAGPLVRWSAVRRSPPLMDALVQWSGLRFRWSINWTWKDFFVLQTATLGSV